MPVNFEKARAQWDRYRYARDNGHLRFVAKADLCDRYFNGDQWDPGVVARLGNRPALTMNQLQATLVAVQGEMAQTRADVAFRPVKTFGTAPDVAELHAETAHALSAVYADVARRNAWPYVESDVVDDALVTSRGWIDVRVGFDEELRGEVLLRRLDPRDVIVDPDATDYDPDRWREVWVSRWLTLDEMEVEWGAAPARHFKGRGASAFEGEDGHDSFERSPAGAWGGAAERAPALSAEDAPARVRVLERQYRKAAAAPHFVDPATGSARRVPPAWPAERVEDVAERAGVLLVERRVSEIFVTVTADDFVLQDGPSVYRHFTPVPFFPLHRNGKSLGVAEGLVSPQDLLNKSLSGELHTVNGTANSGWMSKQGNVVNMSKEEFEERAADTGLVLEVEEMDGTEKISPNPVPTGLDRLSFKAAQFIKDLSGVSDSQRGLDRADVSGVAIQQKRAASSVGTARIRHNLSRTRALVAGRVLDLVQGFYTEPRVLQARGQAEDGGGDGPAEDGGEVSVNVFDAALGRVVNDLTLGEHDVVVAEVPPRDTVEDTEFLEAVEMRRLGVRIPDDVIVAASHLRNKAALARRLSGEESADAAAKAADADLQVKLAEAAQRRGDAREKDSQAALNMVRARVEAQEAEGGGKAAQDAQKLGQDAQRHAQGMAQRDAGFAQKTAQRAAEARSKASAGPQPQPRASSRAAA